MLPFPLSSFALFHITPAVVNGLWQPGDDSVCPGFKLPRSLSVISSPSSPIFFQIFFFASFHPHPYDPSPFDLLFLFSQAHPLKFNIGPFFFPSFLSPCYRLSP